MHALSPAHSILLDIIILTAQHRWLVRRHDNLNCSVISHSLDINITLTTFFETHAVLVVPWQYETTFRTEIKQQKKFHSSYI